MATDLALHIEATRMVDSHEHLRKETEYVEQGPDILQSLFQNYVPADLVVAGASPQAVDDLLDGSNPDLRARFAGVQQAWDAVRHTGYGEAVQLIAREIYALDELTPETIERAQAKHERLRQPGERLRLLRDVALLDHVQTDDFVRPCLPDASGPDFFFYDLSWLNFCDGTPDVEPLAQETGIEVTDLATLKAVMHKTFELNAAAAIAVKSQHAYDRTLQWQEREDAEAERALANYLRDPHAVDEADRLCLGDWCWARGVELAIEYDLPFKLHTGYYAGHSRMPVARIPAGHLAPLLAHYPQARFVLMHIAYPYSDELVALAKHYPNVYADLCWAWSIDPFSAALFVRRFIHAAPANKLFAFGGDTGWPTASVAYAHQARRWLTRALQAEVDEGLLCEADAIALATRVMRANQYACFHVDEKKQTLLQLHQEAVGSPEDRHQ
ncbi:MAG: amidohydrolase family protein [Caldilineaceae bacterium]|nr:amidohydrolase family protein [Caldilineaceae bacterium]